MALLLLSRLSMQIRLVQEDPETPDKRLDGGDLPLVEVLEGAREFLEDIATRLNEIVMKPRGRFVISFDPAQSGSRTPPTAR